MGAHACVCVCVCVPSPVPRPFPALFLLASQAHMWGHPLSCPSSSDARDVLYAACWCFSGPIFHVLSLYFVLLLHVVTQKVIDDSFYFGVEEETDEGGQFPTVYPFSATVPEIGLALLKMSALVVTFLSHLEVPNAGALVFKSLQKGTAVVQTLMLEQLQDAENDMHILKASQISVNSAVSRGTADCVR